MRHFLLVLSFLGPVVRASAQISGDTTVCPGYIYAYTASVPNAVSYDWNFPSGWYEASGLGTTQVTITCNNSAGNVCVSASDMNGIALGTFCIPTVFGGGGTGFDVEPANVQGCSAADVVITLVPNGTGGGCGPCGGLLHPNIDYAAYDNSNFPSANFLGFIDGSPITLYPPGVTIVVVQVDHTNGTDPAHAVVINGGCGGSGNNTSDVTVWQQMPPSFMQYPEAVCIGETVYITVTNAQPPGYGTWHDEGDLELIGGPNDNPLAAIVTGPNAHIGFLGVASNNCPMDDGGYGIQYCMATGMTSTTDAGLALIPRGDGRYMITNASADVVHQVRIFSLSGALLKSTGSTSVDLSGMASALYVLEARTAKGVVAHWKVAR